MPYFTVESYIKHQAASGAQEKYGEHIIVIFFIKKQVRQDKKVHDWLVCVISWDLGGTELVSSCLISRLSVRKAGSSI